MYRFRNLSCCGDGSFSIPSRVFSPTPVELDCFCTYDAFHIRIRKDCFKCVCKRSNILRQCKKCGMCVVVCIMRRLKGQDCKRGPHVRVTYMQWAFRCKHIWTASTCLSHIFLPYRSNAALPSLRHLSATLPLQLLLRCVRPCSGQARMGKDRQDNRGLIQTLQHSLTAIDHDGPLHWLLPRSSKPQNAKKPNIWENKEPKNKTY
jgi:hypothetical protein